MSLDLVALHDKALEQAGKTFRNISKAQWKNSTPDTEWDVRALANHIVSENFWVAPLMAGQSVADVGDRFEGDVLGGDPLQSFLLSARQASDALHEEDAMETKVRLSFGKVPASVYVSQRVLDLVIHNWDLAKAIRQSTRLDPELVAAVTAIVEDQKEDLASSGLFDDPIEVPEDADPQTKLLAMLGRKA